MKKYIVAFILSAVAGHLVTQYALQTAGPGGVTITGGPKYILLLGFGLAGMAGIALHRHGDFLLPQLKARFDKWVWHVFTVFTVLFSGFILFFMDDVAEQPITEDDRAMMKAIAVGLVVLCALMHLIKSQISKSEKAVNKGDLEI